MISNLPPISFVIFIRFFSLIIVLPTLGLYIYDRFGNNITLSFLVVGGYMFFQVILQIPFKIMAQRLGYKGTIIVGLLLFGIGSLFCFVANDFLTIFLGRLLQGSSAIDLVLFAVLQNNLNNQSNINTNLFFQILFVVNIVVSILLSYIIICCIDIHSIFLCVALLNFVSLYIVIYFVSFNSLQFDNFNISSIKNYLNLSLLHFIQKIIIILLILFFGIYAIYEHKLSLSLFGSISSFSVIFGFVAILLCEYFNIKQKKYLFASSFIFFGLSLYFDNIFLQIFLFLVGFIASEIYLQSIVIQDQNNIFTLGILNIFGYFGVFVGSIFGINYLANSSNLFVVVLVLSIFAFALSIQNNNHNLTQQIRNLLKAG